MIFQKLFKGKKEPNIKSVFFVKRTPNYVRNLVVFLFSIFIVVGAIRGYSNVSRDEMNTIAEQRFISMYVSYSLSSDEKERKIGQSYNFDLKNSFAAIGTDEKVSISYLSRQRTNEGDITYLIFIKPFNVTAQISITEFKNDYKVTKNLVSTDFPKFVALSDEFKPIDNQVINSLTESDITVYTNIVTVFFENFNSDRDKLASTVNFDLVSLGEGYFNLDTVKVVGSSNNTDDIIVKVQFVSKESMTFDKQFIFTIKNKEIKNLK